MRESWVEERRRGEGGKGETRGGKSWRTHGGPVWGPGMIYDPLGSIGDGVGHAVGGGSVVEVGKPGKWPIVCILDVVVDAAVRST